MEPFKQALEKVGGPFKDYVGNIDGLLEKAKADSVGIENAYQDGLWPALEEGEEDEE